MADVKPGGGPGHGPAAAGGPPPATGRHGMDVVELLESAGLLVPEEAATANDLSLRDVWDCLAHDDWQVALDVLEEFGDGRPLSSAFWDRLAEAAERLGLERSAAWCHWRSAETRSGMIRADLTLRPAAEARRSTPIPGHGVLRPMWDIGIPAPTGGLSVSVAALWVEDLPWLEPGGRATVRLVPLTPSHWTHVVPGRRINLHEDRTVAGTALVLETRPPSPSH
ncbi:hypothetical protein GCM10010385_17760 [Streptomyces geysiriensis]|nr:hypothetical protein GCM10010385_17760 [Streptomyces geysiriensis]